MKQNALRGVKSDKCDVLLKNCRVRVRVRGRVRVRVRVRVRG